MANVGGGAGAGEGAAALDDFPAEAFGGRESGGTLAACRSICWTTSGAAVDAA
jgi:hypothetical protein